jgi:hypothetical protein
VPEGAGTADIRVVNGNQTSPVASSQFQYERPTVLSLQPPEAFVYERTQLTILGRNFFTRLEDVSVTVDGSMQCSVESCGHTRIICLLPDHTVQEELPMVISVLGQRSDPFPLRFVLKPMPFSLRTAIRGVALFAVLVLLGLMGALIKFKEDRYIKAASVLFSSLILAGGLVMIGSVFFLDSSRAGGCQQALWLASLGFTLQLGTMVLKNYRILLLFKNATMRPKLIRDSVLLSYILLLLAADMALLLPLSEHINCGPPRGTEAVALAASLAATKLLLVCFGVVVAFQSRFIHIREFNERKQLSLAVYTVALSIVFIAPPAILFRTDIEEQYAIRSLSIVFVTLAIQLILFVPKFYKIHQARTNGNRDESGVGMSGRLAKYSSHIGGPVDTSLRYGIGAGVGGAARSEKSVVDSRNSGNGDTPNLVRSSSIQSAISSPDGVVAQRSPQAMPRTPSQESRPRPPQLQLRLEETYEVDEEEEDGAEAQIAVEAPLENNPLASRPPVDAGDADAPLPPPPRGSIAEQPSARGRFL